MIALDIDGVLANYLGGFLAYLKEYKGVILRERDFTHLRFHEILNCTMEEAGVLVRETEDSGILSEIEVFDGAKDAVREISRRGRIYIVTSRNESTARDTINWLEKHFGSNTFEGVFFVGRDDARRKGVICNDMRLKLLVEDELPYAIGAADCGVEVLMVKRRWNREYKGDNERIKIVKDLGEVLKYLENGRH